MRDITLEDTFKFGFTTRAFATGIPTTLAGTPVLSVREEGNETAITAGVSIDVDTGTAAVTGLHEGAVVATAANGYENGKSYYVYISTGTVATVSVVGEVVHEFTIGLSASAIDLANATDGLGAIKSETATILVDTAALNDTKIPDTISLANINAEVDTALATTTYAELGDAIPAATATLEAKINFLYKSARNKTETTSTRVHIYDDAGTNKDHSSVISDDTTTFTKGEFAAGDA